MDLSDFEDVFDAPDGEPTEVFVNPFSCGVDPMRWRDLQVRPRFFPILLHGMRLRGRLQRLSGWEKGRGVLEVEIEGCEAQNRWNEGKGYRMRGKRGGVHSVYVRPWLCARVRVCVCV